MTRATAPCRKDCPNRTVEPNCHMTCEKYLAYQAARDVERAAMMTAKEENRIVTDFEVGCKRRNRSYQAEKSFNKRR